MLAIVGEIMKLCRISGHELISFIALSGLAILYLLFGFFIFNDIKMQDAFRKETYAVGIRKTFLAIAAGITNAILLAGIVCAFQKIIYDGVILIIGLIFTLILWVVLIFANRKRTVSIYKAIFSRSIFLFCIGLTLLMGLMFF